MAEETERVLKIGDKCPNCGATGFSISYSDNPDKRRPPHWGPEILGSGECRGCQQNFLVCLALGLRGPILALLKFNGFIQLAREEVLRAIKILFPKD